MRKFYKGWLAAAVLAAASMAGCGGGGASPGGDGGGAGGNVAPTIATPPVGANVVEPATATFSVSANGTPAPTYQWERSSDGGATFTHIAGATASTYVTPATTPADNATLFRVGVFNVAGNVVSNAAALSVAAASVVPVIVAQPIDTTVTAPGPATFSIVATGSPPLAYQWQLSTNAGASYADIAGAATASYALPATAAADNGHRFRVIVSNASGSATSNGATLTVAATGGGSVQVHVFSDNAIPWNQLVEGADGNFYGATLLGGTSKLGTLYRLTPAGVVTTLHSFGVTGGSPPSSALVQGPDGAFYGTVTSGGDSSSSMGYVFRLQADGTFSILHSFSGPDGANPVGGGALAVGPDGSLYGATIYGGTSNLGTLYKVSPSGTFTSLHSFVSSRTSGYGPQAGLLLGQDGAFYGTTSTGGDQSAPHTGSGSVAGTVFRMTAAGDVTLLHTFFSGGTSTDWGVPQTALVQASNGTLYGTTAQGNLFKIAPDGSGYGVVITASDIGGTLLGRQLVLASDGNLYFGTYDATPAGQYGKIIRVTPAGVVSQVLSFDSTGFYPPNTPLMQARSGSLYGSARGCAGAPRASCGLGDGGVVFRLDLGLPAR